jgi:branched-chain amino acid transport system substrate-binding protein
MKPRRWRIFGVLASVTLTGAGGLVVTASASTEASGAVARVYVSLPREGKGAASAAQIAKGLRVALADHGGKAGGRTIRVVWLNDAEGPRWSRRLVVANARRAAADPSAIAYVGEGNSEATAVSMPIVNRAGLVHLSPVSTAAALTESATAGRYQPTGIQTFFRPVPGDARQSSALLSAVRRAGVRKRVVVVDDGTLYGHGLTQGFQARAARARVRVLDRFVADPDGQGIRALAARVAAQRPAAIVYGGSPSSDAASVLRALHRAAPKALLFGGDALAHDSFVRRLGDAQERLRITTPAAHVDPRQKTGRDLGARPNPFAVFAYNGMQAVLQGIDRAARRGTVTRESVRASVFDGSIQHGLSGAWKIAKHGESVYGVYDILHVASGRIRTPADRLTDKLVREELARVKAKAAGKTADTAKRRASTRSIAPATVRTTIGGMGTLPAMTIQSMDIETALMMVQAERTRLLDAQLQQQIQEVQNRNEQVSKLNTVLNGLNALQARIVGTTADARLDGSEPVERYAGDVAALRAAMLTAGVTLDLGTDAGGWTRGGLDTAITKVKGMIDAAGNSQQMDMLRLQAMSNKRNEAFDVMTNFVKKMQESRSSIIGNHR